MSNGIRVIAYWVFLCLCLALVPLSGCGHKTGGGTVGGEGGVGDAPAGSVPPATTPETGAPLPGGGQETGGIPGEWRAEVWRTGCFLGGFAMGPGTPEFLLVAPVAPGSDAPAAEIVALADGGTQVMARLEDVADWHLTPDKLTLAGVQGSGFYSLAPDGAREALYESQGLHGADLLPGGRGMVLLEAAAGGGSLSVIVKSAAGERVVAERVADVPSEPETGGWPVVPCRVSPDGSRAAFCGTRDGASPALFVIELESGAVIVIPVERPWGVAWAPSGDYIAVAGCGVFPTGGGPPVIVLDSDENAIAWSDDGAYLLTGEAVIAVPGGSRFPLADLGLKVHPAAQVRPLGWVAGAAPGEVSAFVVATWPD